MTITAETRELISEKIEFRESSNGVRTITGYAVKWNMKSHPMQEDGIKFTEQFSKGAFSESLTKDDQRALWSHDMSKILGRTKNGSLRLKEDNIGLRFELDLPNTTVGQDVYESVKRGDIDGVSFGFSMEAEEWDDKNKGGIVRTITKAKLFEISPVTFPAYPDSEVSARNENPFKRYLEERKQKDLRKRLLLKIKLRNIQRGKFD